MPNPSRDQQRAQAAFERVMAVSTEAWRTDYGRQCLHLPALIHQCGLCQAMAFLQAKGSDGGKPWFTRLLRDFGQVTQPGMSPEEFTETVRKIGVQAYQRTSREALQCAQYFKRYAEAILKVKPGDEGEEE